MSTPDTVVERVAARAKGNNTRNDFASDFETKLFRPATIEAVEGAETESSIQFPPLLVRLYTEVANGGFGPGYGLLGVKGGHRDSEGRSIIGAWKYFAREASRDKWPNGLLPVCEWGCGIWSSIDCSSSDYNVVTVDESGLVRTPYSFETWIDEWAKSKNLWNEMYEFDTRMMPKPATGELVPIIIRRQPKGDFWQKWF